MSNIVIDYRLNVNTDDLCWELIKWENEDKVICKIHYTEKSGFSFQEAKHQIMRCLEAISK